MYETFIQKSFSPESVEIIGQSNRILKEYAAQGYQLTLRQLYYQFVARDLLPDKWRDKQTGSKNNIRAYKNLGNLINDARQAGLIDWSYLEDRNRGTSIPGHWTSPAGILRSAAYSFRIDKWENQPYHVEVLVEKDALSGVLGPVCEQLDIGLTANKGYSSASTMYGIGKRLERKSEEGKKIRVLYLGDHDPSGIDMTRDVEDRLGLYSWLGKEVEVVRLALNFNQVLQWNPPENPVKETDSRSEKYNQKFGESCWELDAVEPKELAALVEEAVFEVRDLELWKESVEQENKWRKELHKLAQGYE